MSTNYQATASREGKWWMIRIPAIDGLTQAKKLEDAELMAREYIAASEDIELDDVEVALTVDTVGGVTGISDRVERLNTYRNQLTHLESAVVTESVSLAKDLHACGLPMREIGQVLHLSHQRVEQLIKK